MGMFSDRATSGQAFDIRSCFQLLTLDTIGEVGFGLQLDAVKNRGAGNIILEKLRAQLHNAASPPAFIQAALVLTELQPFFELLVRIQVKYFIGFFAPAGYILNAIKQMVHRRREEPNSRRNDILQMMVDVSAETAANNQKGGPTFEQPSTLASFQMTDDEIAANGFVFFVAGYETTSTSLGFAAYLLAKNQDIQDKLAKEILLHYPKVNGEFPDIDYETAMNKIPYLEWVCHEVIRLYPVAMNVLSRFVMNDTSLCGVSVPKAVWAVLIDTWTIHNNEQLWGPVDTSKFYPERFSPENSESRPASAFIPFGFGPRQCLGKRLALLQMKVTLANLLLRFQIFEPDGGYPGGDGLRISSKSGPLISLEAVRVKLIPRE